MLTLGFAGLPSAGKSTTINALAGKRVLESGVCRTTTEICLVGTTDRIGAAQKWVRTKLESDDGVEFCALDLPGICDAEDTSGSFNKVTLEWAAKCDVVVWVTDARTAFLTTHEVREYQALRDAIQEKADEDGTLYQYCIVIAKYDATHSTKCTKFMKTNNPVARFLEGEIRTDTEETTIDSCFARVERMFPETRVAKFSAFARIVRRGSEALRALVSASTTTSVYTDGTNDTFDLAWATDDLVEKRLAQMSRVLRSTRSRAIAAREKADRERDALTAQLAEAKKQLERYVSTKIFEISHGNSSVRAEIEMIPSILVSECADVASVADAFRAFVPSAPLSFELRTFYTGHQGAPHELFAIIVSAEWGAQTVCIPSHMLHMIGPSEWIYHDCQTSPRPEFKPTRNIKMNIGDIFLHSEPRQPAYQYPCGPHAYSISPNTKSFGICVNGAIYGRGDKCMDCLVVGRLKDTVGVINALLGTGSLPRYFQYSLPR
jgi:predicted GTPase